MSDLWADPDFVRDELEQRGPETPIREPRAGDPVYLHGDRRTVLAVRPDGYVRIEDADGFAVSRHRMSMWWDGEAWRSWGDGA